ncbi:hypothetical protein [Leisingera caerulea]|uniref:hypothetical protein n=1 Tax=Leisingera caerulea TaxID=506591 RepID=UPI00047F7502|nr:hypothetical protein [Leisingera caerulea]
MTRFVWQVDFFAPIGTAIACNRAANAWGISGQNFLIRLSPTGAEPATHLGGSARETDLFVRAVEAAPGLPEGLGEEFFPKVLDKADWQAVGDHLVLTHGPADTTNARAQFEALIVGHGLKKILANPSQ